MHSLNRPNHQLLGHHRGKCGTGDAEEREEAEMVLGQHPKWVDNRRIGQVRVPEPMTEQQSMLGAWA
jgi:hypothetical protein